MDTLIIGTLTTGEWLVVAGSALLSILALVPVLWGCWLFVRMSDGAVDRAINDAQRAALVKSRARGDVH